MESLLTWAAESVSWIVAGLLFIPYLLWGVYVLRHTRFRQEVFRLRTEAATLVLVVIFLVIEYKLVMIWLGNRPVQHVLAMLSLSISAIALYGPTAVSVVARLLVEEVMPSGHTGRPEPQYGPGETCERRGDFEGAAREYMAVASMFPKDATAVLRAADNLSKAGQSEQAVVWFERGLGLLDSPERSLSVANRVFEICRLKLNRPERARAILDLYLRRFPQAEYVHSVQERLKSLSSPEKFAREEDKPPAPSYLPEIEESATAEEEEGGDDELRPTSYWPNSER